MCKAYGRARDYERAHGRSGLWRVLACGRVGGRRETAGFMTNRLEFVEEGRSEKKLRLRAIIQRFLLHQDTAAAAAACFCLPAPTAAAAAFGFAIVGDERIRRPAGR